MLKLNQYVCKAKNIPAIVKKQPGYSGFGEYMVAMTASGSGLRLYVAAGGKWMDASLEDVPGLSVVSAWDGARKNGTEGGSAKTPAKQSASRANGAKGGRPYRWMIVRKISGIPVSRHATREAADKAWRDDPRDPLETREYNDGYWREMKV